jgi:hypothetical protein
MEVEGVGRWFSHCRPMNSGSGFSTHSGKGLLMAVPGRRISEIGLHFAIRNSSAPQLPLEASHRGQPKRRGQRLASPRQKSSPLLLPQAPARPPPPPFGQSCHRSELDW